MNNNNQQGGRNADISPAVNNEVQIRGRNEALWAKKLMKVAEHNGDIMTDDQYDGGANRQAQSAVLNKILDYDINRQNMQEAQGCCGFDMRSNCDRELVRLVAAEARLKLRLHERDASFMINCIEKQQFHIKT